MSKLRKVRILNAVGAGELTSPKQALKMVAEGRATLVDAWTIRMLEGSEKHQAVAAAIARSDDTRSARLRHGAKLRVVPQEPDTFLGQTFIPYPQPGSFRRAA